MSTAPAKVNLYLHVVGRRGDGYHELDSLIAFADVGDEVTAADARDITLGIGGPFAGDLLGGPENLVLKAARLLQARAGAKRGARLSLVKRLPVASGLGGGSSDAAAAIRELAALWNAELDAAAVLELAAEVGADVPVCVAARPAFVGGAGERLDPAPRLPPAWLVLANPGVALKTPAVFAARVGAFSDPARFDDAPADAAALAALLVGRRNDLTDAAMRLAPGVRTALGALERLPGALVARMSGSGATCFAVMADEGAARAAAKSLKGAFAGWWIAAAPLLPDGGIMRTTGGPSVGA